MSGSPRSEQPPLSEHYVPYLLNQADHVLSKRLQCELQRRGIHNSDWRVLAILDEAGACTVGQLAAHVRLPQPTITHSISRLADRGLLSRQEVASDRRRRIVSLTDQGAAEAKELVDMAGQFEAETLDGFEDADQLRQLLQDLIAHVTDRLEG